MSSTILLSFGSDGNGGGGAELEAEASVEAVASHLDEPASVLHKKVSSNMQCALTSTVMLRT